MPNSPKRFLSVDSSLGTVFKAVNEVGAGRRQVYTERMQPIYQAADPLEAEILRGYLQTHGIEINILGAGLWAARGELQVDAYPRLILRNESDRPRATELLRVYEHRRHASTVEWRCNCGESSPTNFETCWSCAADRPA